MMELALAYTTVGVVVAAAALASRRASALDAVLLAGMWPLYGPVLLGMDRSAPPVVDEREEAMVRALRKAAEAGTPLAATLPDEAHARALAARMRDGRARLAELDRVLARPDLDEDAARARAHALERGGGHPGAVATAMRRVHTIRRLRELRRSFAADLDEVDEVVTQLTVQLELVSLAGGLDTAAELAADLCARVEALDDLAGQLPGSG